MNMTMMSELVVLHNEVNREAQPEREEVVVAETAVSRSNLLDRLVEALRKIQFASLRPEWIQTRNEQHV